MTVINGALPRRGRFAAPSRRDFSRRAGLAAIAAAALLLPGAAAAGSTPEPNALRSSLKVEVSGEISPVCRMGRGTQIDFGDLTVPGKSFAAHVPLYCNMPFDMKVAAQNGGLAHATMPEGQGPYEGRLGYQMSLTIPVRRPREKMVGGSFNSQALRGGKVISSQGGVAFDGVNVRVALNKPGGAGLLAGQYSETIVMEVAPHI